MPLPPKPAEPMTVLTCQVPPRIVQRILAEAARDDRTRSYVIRRILKAHFDAADAAKAAAR